MDINPLTTLALIGPLGWPELLVIGVLGVILFGRRLPEVGKNIGRGIVEFKKGLAGLEDDVDNADKDHDRIQKSQTDESVEHTQRSGDPEKAH